MFWYFLRKSSLIVLILTIPGDLMNSSPANSPAIFVVATPIGNLDDLSPRARKILADVDLIAAEDTRETRKLLNLIGVGPKEIISYQDHGESERASQLIRRIQDEAITLALVSDAGTPCISDPGYRLVHLARQEGIKVHPVPGPSAMLALASISGLPTNRLMFVGFLPVKAAAKTKEIRSWPATNSSIIFFEATRRLARTLAAVEAIFPFARVAVGRELTKLFEESVVMEIRDALAWALGHPTMKGEAVVMVDLAAGSLEVTGASEEAEMTPSKIRKKAEDGFARGSSLKDLLNELSGAGMNRSDLYQLLLSVKKSLV